MYDKPENAVLSLSRRERVLLDPLGASKKSDNKKKKEPSESEIMQADLEPIIAPIEPEIAPIPPVETEEFEMKSASLLDILSVTTFINSLLNSKLTFLSFIFFTKVIKFHINY